MTTIETLAAAELLKAFYHPTGLAILQELLAGPKCVTDMEELLPASYFIATLYGICSNVPRIVGIEEGTYTEIAERTTSGQ